MCQRKQERRKRLERESGFNRARMLARNLMWRWHRKRGGKPKREARKQ